MDAQIYINPLVLLLFPTDIELMLLSRATVYNIYYSESSPEAT